MYEKNFGLRKRPFRAKAVGPHVFVGPQTATVMAGIKKALVIQDSIVTVVGPAGSGKTTIVGKALEVMSASHISVRLGRMQLDSNDVLDFVLEELGVDGLPSSAIRRFGIFRRRLAELEAEGKRLVIVVEDALRAGVETLAEIEALTAGDAGVSDGAAVVLMGDQRLPELVRDAQLQRLNQRVHGRLQVAPLNAAEMRGYLMHCFRLAGNDFELIFDSDTAVCLHGLTDGIPRVANQLVEAALVAAADRNLERIPARFIEETALNEFGLRPASRPAPPPAVTQKTPAAPPTSPADAQPAEPVGVPTAGETADDDDIPDLIQDTLPDLAVLSDEIGQPEITAEASPEPEAEPQAVSDSAPVSRPSPEPELTLETEAEPATAPSSASVPEWDRDPTCAELRPDLEALERAMAVARETDEDEGEDEAQPPILTAAVPARPKAAEVKSDEIPEITLDDAIRERIENNLIDEPGQISPLRQEQAPAAETQPAPESKATSKPPPRNPKADAELERIASQLAKAKTIEDVDDKLAETLFGEEINFIAAQVVGKHADIGSANDEIQVAQGEPAVTTQRNEPELSLESDDTGVGRPVLPGSQSPRSDVAPGIEVPRHTDTGASRPKDTSPAAESPESIEDQITSMTQTLKALNVRPPISSGSRPRAGFDDDDDDDDDEPKSGFFSRFRRG